jgi:hypothetical protein
MDVPLLIHNAEMTFAAEGFRYNRDLASWLYRAA